MLIDQQRAVELGEAIIDAAEITKKQGVPTYVMPMNNTFIAVKRNLGGDDYVDPNYLLYIESQYIIDVPVKKPTDLVGFFMLN